MILTNVNDAQINILNVELTISKIQYQSCTFIPLKRLHLQTFVLKYGIHPIKHAMKFIFVIIRFRINPFIDKKNTPFSNLKECFFTTFSQSSLFHFRDAKI